MKKELVSEDILKEAVKIACETEDKIYEKNVEETEHKFSDEYRTKMESLLAYAAHEEKTHKQWKHDNMMKYHRGFKKRYLLAMILIMLMASVTVFAVEPIREKVIQFIEQTFSDHTDVVIAELDGKHGEKLNLPDEFHVHKLGSNVEGYSLKEEEIDETFYEYTAIYSKGARTLIYQQIAKKYADITITSDGTKATPITINGVEGYYIKDEQGWNTIFYIDDYVYKIGGKEKTETLIKILEEKKKD